jgi:hypothetical protein
MVCSLGVWKWNWFSGMNVPAQRHARARGVTALRTADGRTPPRAQRTVDRDAVSEGVGGDVLGIGNGHDAGSFLRRAATQRQTRHKARSAARRGSHQVVSLRLHGPPVGLAVRNVQRAHGAVVHKLRVGDVDCAAGARATLSPCARRCALPMHQGAQGGALGDWFRPVPQSTFAALVVFQFWPPAHAIGRAQSTRGRRAAALPLRRTRARAHRRCSCLRRGERRVSAR